jgi:hypothetical protein
MPEIPPLEPHSPIPADAGLVRLDHEPGFVAPPFVYRYLSGDERYGDDFTRGRILISTLEKCRQHENAALRDEDEASQTLRVESIAGDASDPDIQQFARRAQSRIGPGLHLTLSGISITVRETHAWVLCTTLSPPTADAKGALGDYCIKIGPILPFFCTLSYAISQRRSVRQNVVGRVKYRARDYGLYDPEPGVLGFVKSPDKYEHEQELRMLWLPEEREVVKPFVIDCPEVARYCQRIF